MVLRINQCLRRNDTSSYLSFRLFPIPLSAFLSVFANISGNLSTHVTVHIILLHYRWLCWGHWDLCNKEPTVGTSLSFILCCKIKCNYASFYQNLRIRNLQLVRAIQTKIAVIAITTSEVHWSEVQWRKY
jgi:hypothetical protein